VAHSDQASVERVDDGEPRHQRSQRVVEVEESALACDEGEERGEHLGDVAEAEHRRFGHRLVGRDVGQTEVA
jgi:hypothetical protein